MYFHFDSAQYQNKKKMVHIYESIKLDPNSIYFIILLKSYLYIALIN